MLRIAHIRRDSESSPSDPRYDLFDAGRWGEESGFAEPSRSLTSNDLKDWLAREDVPDSTIEKLLRELEKTGSAQVRLAPRVGPRIVRAWFATVFNPLIPSLELEIGLLGKRNWTFSFAPPALDLIRPVMRYLRGQAHANLEQVLQLNAALAANTEAHDAAVESLLSSVNSLHGSLVANRGFADLCNSLLAPETLLKMGIQDAREIFGAYPPTDRLKLIAQYVVNATDELPAHYSTAKFWNPNRERFLESLTLPDVRERYAAAVQIAEHLSSVSATLLKQLKDLRLDLSLRHDVPYVEGRAKLTA